MAQKCFKIADANKVKLISKGDGINKFESITIANIHSGTATMDLYLASQSSSSSTTGGGITSTTVLAAETEAASTSSVTLTVDTVSATSEVFLNERIYKVDGTFFGTCTAVNSSTEIVFSGGLSSAITDNDILHVGTRYYIFKSLALPVGQMLKLESNEVSFDNRIYSFYIKLAGTTPVDVIIN